MTPPLTFRLTELGDASFLTQWLTDPEILCWFPMTEAREIEDSVRIWINYAKIKAGLTALVGEEICAMACLYIQPYIKQKHTCLFSIIVRKDLRGKGIGRALMEKLIQHAKEEFGIETLHLEVYEGNPAQRLYERMGFVSFGRQERFIKIQGQYNAKVMMQKAL